MNGAPIMLMRRYSSANGRTPADAPIASTIQRRRGEARRPRARRPSAPASQTPSTPSAAAARRLAGTDLAGDGGGRRVGEEVEDGERRGEHGAGDGEAGELAGPELADDRGVDEHVERFGRERPERRQREPPDLGVVGAAPGRQHPAPRSAMARRLWVASACCHTPARSSLHGRSTHPARGFTEHGPGGPGRSRTGPVLRFADAAKRLGAATRAAAAHGAGLPVPPAGRRCPPHRPPLPGRRGGVGACSATAPGTRSPPTWSRACSSSTASRARRPCACGPRSSRRSAAPSDAEEPIPNEHPEAA